MLRGMSNFLFGNGSANSEQQYEEYNLKTQVTDEDWILVETQTNADPSNQLARATTDTADDFATITEDTDLASISPAHSSSSSSSSKYDVIEDITIVTPHIDLAPPPKTCSWDTAIPSEHTISLPSDFICIFSVGPSESWIVDPPACFTASQDGSGEASVLQTTMENLLIEHPSMSVYDSYSRNINSDGEDSDEDNEDEDDQQQQFRGANRRPTSPFEAISLPVISSRPVRTNRAAPCPQNLATSQPLLTKLKTYRLMLQKQSYEQSRHFNKKYLNRNNKLHEYSHLGKRQRHRARYQCPSGRMNGRIGQRRAY